MFFSASVSNGSKATAEDTDESFQVNFLVYDFFIQKLIHTFPHFSKSIYSIYFQFTFFITFAEELVYLGFSTDKGINPRFY